MDLSTGKYMPCPRCGDVVRKDRFQEHLEVRCSKLKPGHPYADILPRKPVPTWLRKICETDLLPTTIPIKDVLADSCYYPSCGIDATPIVLLNGFVHSFIYVDYGVTKEELQKELELGFRGYELVKSRAVESCEVVQPGWQPNFYDLNLNINNLNIGKLERQQKLCRPFGIWSVWKRKPGYDEDVWPEMFSLLYLGAEGVAAYQGLYVVHNLSPKVLAIIQPGDGFGYNWTRFFNPSGPLWQTIVSSNRYPEYTLLGYGSRRNHKEAPLQNSEFQDYRIMRYSVVSYGRKYRNADVQRVALFENSRMVV